MNREASREQQSYTSIQIPTVIVAGSDDRIVSPEQSSQLSQVIRQAKAEIIPSAGHMVHHAAPQRVAELISKAASVDAQRGKISGFDGTQEGTRPG
jgi:pimeloyl-ACP methyl ester carboxylesterase